MSEIELQHQEKNCKNKIELLKCPDCGNMALALNDYRIVGTNCKIWDTVHTWSVSSGELLDVVWRKITKLYLR